MESSTIVVIIVLSLAVSTISLTIAKMKVFAWLRAWLKERQSGFGQWLSELVQCPYCTSTWVAFGAVAVYHPVLVHSPVYILDLAVSAFAIVALAAAVSGVSAGALWIIKTASEPPKQLGDPAEVEKLRTALGIAREKILELQR